MDDVDYYVRKLNEAKAISEYHFRDAVEDMIEQLTLSASLGDFDEED